MADNPAVPNSIIDNDALYFVKNWHHVPVVEEDLTYHGINLGEMDEYDLLPDVMSALYRAQIVEREQSREQIVQLAASEQPSASQTFLAEIDLTPVLLKPGAFSLSRMKRQADSRRLNQRGEALYRRGAIREAVEQFVHACNMWNEDPVYFSNLGASCFALGLVEDAWNHLLHALHLDPSFISARENLREVGKALNRLEEAERILLLFGNRTL